MIDIVNQRAIVHTVGAADLGGYVVEAIPPAYVNQAAELRRGLIETLVDLDETIAELFLVEAEIRRSAEKKAAPTRYPFPVSAAMGYFSSGLGPALRPLAWTRKR